MQRPVSTLNLPQSIRTRLHNAGYRLTADLADAAADPTALATRTYFVFICGGNSPYTDDDARPHFDPPPFPNLPQSTELGITLDQAMTTIKQLGRVPLVSTSALDALTVERARHAITSSSHAFDGLMGGAGMRTGRVTEICGPPGMGKTQFGMQFCVNVQIPSAAGGVDGEAVFIDTEGSFIVDRVVEIASATREELHSHQIQEVPTIETMLSRIHFFRVHSHVEQVALINQLDEFLASHPKIKLIVIDSIAFHFRQKFADMGQRTRLLNGMAQRLRALAENRDVAVVMTNQMTTRIRRVGAGLGDGDSATLVPALGDSWGHACTNRVILSWQDDARQASLVKSPNLPEATVLYAITADGVRDIAGFAAPPAPAAGTSNSRKRPHSELGGPQEGP
ncbi:DNA repair protein rad51c [Geranomyces variabilis]|uniref:DNA repair protein RAD51 homolog 3 n=1 Tax=Geranomyces variabilis TaxID=109894 RepID=A0AAD5TKP3_9FUNG|nr:DNA repair protein rad51c [Geranomyces variabilis]